MDTRVVQAALGFVVAALVLAVASVGSSIFGSEPDKPTFDLAMLLATPTPDASLPEAPEEDFSAPAETLYLIANTGGEGVRLRSSCSDDALGAGVWSDGAPITPIGRQESCPGWLLAIRGGEVSWIKEQFVLVATRTPVPTPTATPTPVATTQALAAAPPSAAVAQPVTTTAPPPTTAPAPASARAPEPTVRPPTRDEPTELYRGATQGGTCTVSGDIVKCTGPQGSWTCTTTTGSYFCVGPSGEEERCAEIGNRLYCGATAGSNPDSESWTCNRVGSMTTCYGLGDGGTVNCERIDSQLVCRGNQGTTQP